MYDRMNNDWMKKLMDEQMNESMKEWMNERMNKWMKEQINIYVIYKELKKIQSNVELIKFLWFLFFYWKLGNWNLTLNK